MCVFVCECMRMHMVVSLYGCACSCVADLDEEAVGDGEELEVPLRGDHVPVVLQRRLFAWCWRAVMDMLVKCYCQCGWCLMRKGIDGRVTMCRDSSGVGKDKTPEHCIAVRPSSVSRAHDTTQLDEIPSLSLILTPQHNKARTHARTVSRFPISLSSSVSPP